MLLVRVLRGFWHTITSTVSGFVVAVCLSLFVLVTFFNIFHVSSTDRIVSLLGLSYSGIVEHKWFFQFFSAPLLHVGVVHLAFNMLALWMLGPDIEYAMGRARYILFSLSCSFLALVGFLLLDGNGGGIVLGYSGIIFGILVAQAVLFPDRLIYVYFFFPIKMKYAVLIMGAIELYLVFSQSASGIAHSAHVFGALGGLVWLPVLRNIARNGPIFTMRRRATRRGASGIDQSVRRSVPAWVAPLVSAAGALGRDGADDVSNRTRGVRMPGAARRAARSIDDLAGLLDRMGSGGYSEDEESRLRECLESAWDASASASLPDVMVELARVAAEWEITGLSDRIVEAVGKSAFLGCSASAMDNLESAMRRMGDEGVSIVLCKLVEERVGSTQGFSLLDFFAAMKSPGKARCMADFYTSGDRMRRERLISWLCELYTRSPVTLMDIIGGLLRSMPSGMDLTAAVRDRLGPTELMEEAIRWAARGHKGSIMVLQRLYDYPSSAFNS